MRTRALVLAVVIVVVLLGFVPQPEDKVVFLDVGQGDAILLQNKTTQVLIDGGQGMAVLARLGEEMPWFDRRIDVVVLTHPQRDHVEGLLHVLERYDVGLILLPKVAYTSQLQDTWLQMIQDRDIPFRFAWAGQRLTVGDMSLSILGPFDSEAARAAARADLNNASVMARVDYGDVSFLLTGDAEKRVETTLVHNTSPGVLDVDVIKAGHHGSNTSTHQQLITAASPSAAIISVGADNKFGHPHPAVLGRLGEIRTWRTDEDGSIRFSRVNGRWLLSTQGR